MPSSPAFGECALNDWSAACEARLGRRFEADLRDEVGAFGDGARAKRASGNLLKNRRRAPARFGAQRHTASAKRSSARHESPTAPVTGADAITKELSAAQD